MAHRIVCLEAAHVRQLSSSPRAGFGAINLPQLVVILVVITALVRSDEVAMLNWHPFIVLLSQNDLRGAVGPRR